MLYLQSLSPYSLELDAAANGNLWYSGEPTQVGYSGYYNYTIDSLRAYDWWQNLGTHYWDPFGQTIMKCVMPYPVTDPILAWTGSSTLTNYEVSGFKPIVTGREVPDVVRKADLFRHIGQFFTGNWSFRNSVGFVPRENPITHASLYGHVTTNEELFVQSYPGNLTSGFDVVWQFTRDVDNNLALGSPYNQGGQSPLALLGSSEFLSFCEGTDLIIGPSGTWNVSGFSFDYNGSSCLIRYSVKRHMLLSLTDYLDSKFSVEIEWLPLTYEGVPPVNSSVPIRDYIKATCNITWNFEPFVIHTNQWGTESIHSYFSHYGQSPPAIADELFDTWTTTQAIVSVRRMFGVYQDFQDYCGPLDVDTAGFLVVRPTYESERSFGVFTNICESLRRDVHSHATIAANSALDDISGKLSSNYVETVSEARSLLGAVDILEYLEQVHRMTARGGRGVPAIGWIHNFLTLATSANLLLKFGLLPNKEAAEEFSSSFSRIRSAIEGFSKHGTSNGRYDYVLPSSFTRGWDDVGLTTRVKLRYRVNDELLISSLIPLDASRTIPSLSNLWASIPFSFAADWLFDFSGLLETFDNQIISLGLNVEYSVISQCFSWEFPDTAPFRSLSTDPEEFDGYRFYTRYALLAYPTLTPTRLPTFYLQKSPSWDILGSLVYQLIT